MHARLSQDGRWGTAAFYFQDHLRRGDTDGAFTALWARRFGPVEAGCGGRFTTYGDSRIGSTVGDRIDAQYFHHYGMGCASTPVRLRLEIAGEIVNSRAESHGALSTCRRRTTGRRTDYGCAVSSSCDPS